MTRGPFDQARFFRIFGYVVAIEGPEYPALYTERNRVGVRVFPLLRGWRVTLRKIQP